MSGKWGNAERQIYATLSRSCQSSERVICDSQRGRYCWKALLKWGKWANLNADEKNLINNKSKAIWAQCYIIFSKRLGKKGGSKYKETAPGWETTLALRWGKMSADSGVLTDLMVGTITATVRMTYETHGSNNDSYDLLNTYCDTQTLRRPPMTFYPDVYTQYGLPHTQRIGLHCTISKTRQHASSKIWAKKKAMKLLPCSLLDCSLWGKARHNVLASVKTPN